MANDAHSISGQRPKVKWKRNRGRKRRTIDESIALAKRFGVEIPDDVMFIEADKGDLPGTLTDLLSGGEMVTARGPRVAERIDGYAYWEDHFHRLTGKIPFRIHPDIFTSDEAIEVDPVFRTTGPGFLDGGQRGVRRVLRKASQGVRLARPW